MTLTQLGDIGQPGYRHRGVALVRTGGRRGAELPVLVPAPAPAGAVGLDCAGVIRFRRRSRSRPSGPAPGSVFGLRLVAPASEPAVCPGPQHHAVPSDLSAQVCAWPPEIAVTPTSPTTRTGTRRLLVVASPSWYRELLPQHHGSPSLSIAHVCRPPAVMLVTSGEVRDLNRCVRVRRGVVAELAVMIRAPAPRRPIGLRRAGVQISRNDVRRAHKIGDPNRLEPVLGRPVTELTAMVGSPTPREAVERHTAAVRGTGGDRGEIRDVLDPYRRGTAGCGGVAELAAVVGAPTPCAAVRLHRACMRVAGRNGNDVELAARPEQVCRGRSWCHRPADRSGSRPNTTRCHRSAPHTKSCRPPRPPAKSPPQRLRPREPPPSARGRLPSPRYRMRSRGALAASSCPDRDYLTRDLQPRVSRAHVLRPRDLRGSRGWSR